MASLSLQHINKTYEWFEAVKDFNLESEDKGVYHLCRTFRMW